jgi:hypothetical protein
VTFLASRGIELPHGIPDSPPEEESVPGSLRGGGAVAPASDPAQRIPRNLAHRLPERAHGYATTGQTIVRVPDGTAIRLFVDGNPVTCKKTEVRGV